MSESLLWVIHCNTLASEVALLGSKIRWIVLKPPQVMMPVALQRV